MGIVNLQNRISCEPRYHPPQGCQVIPTTVSHSISACMNHSSPERLESRSPKSHKHEAEASELYYSKTRGEVVQKRRPSQRKPAAFGKPTHPGDRCPRAKSAVKISDLLASVALGRIKENSMPRMLQSSFFWVLVLGLRTKERGNEATGLGVGLSRFS